jgi:predicted DNA-binding transcriptional regulator YafY
MDRTERFYHIEKLLQERTSVPVATFLEELGISIATFKRDLDYLRDRFKAPIVWDRKTRGYRFDPDHGQTGEFSHALPGLWFRASEIHALLTMRHLLAEVQPGLLDPHVQPLLNRLTVILASGDHAPEAVEHRVRILHTAQRIVDAKLFPEIAQAVLQRRRLQITHFNRETGASIQREVSPQRLVHYRGNWYLDALCHLRQSLRRFSVDVIETVYALPSAAEDVDEAVLEAELASGYGIFAGRDVQWAVLRFTAARARWVQAEHWHPKQIGQLDESGRYWLKLPYSQPQELIMDILRHGDQVEVVEPEILRAAVAGLIRRMAETYQK